MAIDLQNIPVVPLRWTQFKAIVLPKVLSMQYDTDPANTSTYEIFAIDDDVAYRTTIWLGTMPSIDPDYSQGQNDTDKSDFETNYKSYCNKQIVPGSFSDSRIKYFLGNKTTLATSEVLVGSTYNEQASQAQRSLVSSSANDANPGGSGARIVRVEFLNNAFTFKTEDVQLNGTTPVNMVATDVRYIQAMYVIAGTAAAGTITMKSTTAGGGTDVCIIASSTESAFLCHYYCPAGMRAFILKWGSTVDDEASLKIKGQTNINSLIVDTNRALEKLFAGNPTPPTRINFEQPFLGGMPITEKTYTRVTVTPNQTTSTTTRSWLYIWEDKA